MHFTPSDDPSPSPYLHDDDLDLELLHSLIDQFSESIADDSSTLPKPSSDIIEDIQTEVNPDLVSLLQTIARKSIWPYINSNLLSNPLICINCSALVCYHISESLGSEEKDEPDLLRSVWNDTQLASYFLERHNTLLEFGLLN